MKLTAEHLGWLKKPFRVKTIQLRPLPGEQEVKPPVIKERAATATRKRRSKVETPRFPDDARVSCLKCGRSCRVSIFLKKHADACKAIRPKTRVNKLKKS